MKYSDYINKRKELLNKADKFKDSENVDELNKVISEINSLDNEYSELKNKYDSEYEKYVNAVEQSNEKALNGERPNFNFADLFSNDSFGNVLGGGEVKSVFLNKSDKLSDRVKMTDDERQLLNQDGALGNVVKGIITGKWTSPEFKNIVGTTATGTLIPEVLSARIIDKARELSLFTNAGVPIAPMDTNNMTISRIKSDPNFKFKEEGKEGQEADFELDSVKLESKTAYGYAYVSIEAINSSTNLDSILNQVFAQAMANAIDKAFIYGQETTPGTKDSYAPGGIMNDIDICSITATSSGGYDDFIKAIGKVKKENGNPTVYGINSDTEQLLSLLKTTEGQYLAPPKAIENMTGIVSNQLAHDDTNGNDALVFDPYALLIGIQNNIQIKIIEDQECLKKGLVGFQIYSMLDCKTTVPKHICKITGIK